jgi:hypothetical protein
MGLFDGMYAPGGGLLGNMQDPQQVGLLSAGLGLLASSGPSTTPIGFGQAAGRAGLLGIQAYQSALDHQLRRDEMQSVTDYRKAQAAQMNQKLSDAKDLNDFLKSRLLGAPGAMPPADMDAATTALGQGARFGDIGPTVTNASRMDAIRPPQLQGQNSSFPFSLNDVTLLKAKGLDLTDVYKLATDPIQMNGGSVYRDRVTGSERYIPKLPEGMTLGPGGAASVVPGYIQGNNAIKGGEAYSQEAGKAQLDPFYGVDAQGNRVLLGSRAQALGYGANAGGTRPISFPGGDIGPSGAGGAGIVTERSPFANAYDTDVAKDFAARYSTINKAGFAAPGQIAKLERIGKLLADHDGGKLSQTGLELAQYANSMGFKIDKSLANKEAAAALSNELALSLRDTSNGAGMPGAMSDADRQFLTSMSPNLGQSREGRRQIIDAGIAVQRRNQQVAEMARKYSKKYGRVDENFYNQLQSWADRNPLFGEQ